MLGVRPEALIHHVARIRNTNTTSKSRDSGREKHTRGKQEQTVDRRARSRESAKETWFTCLLCGLLVLGVTHSHSHVTRLTPTLSG